MPLHSITETLAGWGLKGSPRNETINNTRSNQLSMADLGALVPALHYPLTEKIFPDVQ